MVLRRMTSLRCFMTALLFSFVLTGYVLLLRQFRPIISLGVTSSYDKYFVNTDPKDIAHHTESERTVTTKATVTVGVAICGDRLNQSIVMLKSLILFSRNVQELRVVAFQDNSTSNYLEVKLLKLQKSAKKIGVVFIFEIIDSWFPEMDDKDKNKSWQNWFAPCSSQRLFFPSLLPDVDKILHLDTDLLILTDIMNVWNHFEEMDRRNQIAAMAPELMPPGDGWYNTKAKIPYYGPRGLNAGIMLMNLEAMRKLYFQNVVWLVYQAYKEELVWADQDILNVYFRLHKSYMHELPCDMNYMVQFCWSDVYNINGLAVNCTQAEKNGISIFHGNRAYFHHFEMARNMFRAFKDYKLESNAPDQLLNRLMLELLEYKKTRQPCSYLSEDIFKNFQRYVGPSNFTSNGSVVTTLQEH